MTGTIYCGVDFHARMQRVSYCDTRNGEIHGVSLDHRKDDVRGFYEQFTGEVIVGIEASGYSAWFEAMLEELGHTLWTGHATEIRRRANWRQKNDCRDADLILELMLRGDFPLVHRHSRESVDVLRMLRYRQRLVKMRTMINNNLQAIAISSGLSERSRLLTPAGQERLKSAKMTTAFKYQCEDLISLLAPLNERISRADKMLKQQASADARVKLLMTHPGVGLLTALGVVHTLEPFSRFSKQKAVVAYVGLEPMERSSAEKKRYLGISKGGSRLLRFFLGEAAHVAVRYEEDLGRFYVRLSKRRGKPKAAVAVARKLLLRCWIMLRDNIDYAEFRRRGVEARLARQCPRPDMPGSLIEQPASSADLPPWE
jgi:transposase